MGIELVAQDEKACVGVRLDQPLDVLDKIRFGSGVSNRWGQDFPCSQIKIACEDLGAVPDVVELSAFHLPCPGRQRGPVALKGLNARFLVNTDDTPPLGLIVGCGQSMHVANQPDLLGKLVPVFNVGMLPIPTSVGL